MNCGIPSNFEPLTQKISCASRAKNAWRFDSPAFFCLKKEHEKTLDLKLDLQQKVISPQRALAMAKNIFVRGDFKRLREAVRRHKKDSLRLAQNLVSFSQQEKIFRSTDWTLFPRATFLQQQYYLTKQRTLLGVEKTRLDQLNLSLQDKQTELDARCREPEAQHQIEVIAAGILRKNFRHVRQLEEIDARAKELAQRMNHAKGQMIALKERLSRDKHTTCYKVVSSNISSNGQRRFYHCRRHLT